MYDRGDRRSRERLQVEVSASGRTVYARPRPRERATRAAAPDERIHGTRVGVARRTPSIAAIINSPSHLSRSHHRTPRPAAPAAAAPPGRPGGRYALACRCRPGCRGPATTRDPRAHETRRIGYPVCGLKAFRYGVIISRDAQPRPRTALACCVLAVAPRDLTYARTHTQRVDSPLMFAHHALSSSQAHNAFSASR